MPLTSRKPASPLQIAEEKCSDHSDQRVTSSPSQVSEIPADSTILGSLLYVGHQIRKAQTTQELCFILANETRRLVNFRQACIFSFPQKERNRCKVEAVSSVATLDRRAPMIVWLERVVRELQECGHFHLFELLTSAQCPHHLQEDWHHFAFPYVMWCPLTFGAHHVPGGIWLARETPWQDSEVQVIRQLADTAAHAWLALQHMKPIPKNWQAGRQWIWIFVGALMVAVMWMPVQLSALAPVEVVPRDPSVVAAPLDGVIAKVLVHPNTMVKEGEPLFRYEDTKFRTQFDVAEKNLSVTLMEYHQAAQGAFLDVETGAGMPVQASEVRVKEAERDYAWELLQQVEVKAPRTGIVIFGDPSEWTGKPVVVGERVMEVADPHEYQLKIDLPVQDAIVLREGAAIDVFLDANPLEAISGRITHASYHASVLPTQVLAYRIEAELLELPEHIRIGWQGTAKIYGDTSTLFFYLFRRPLGTLRQVLGFS